MPTSTEIREHTQERCSKRLGLSSHIVVDDRELVLDTHILAENK